MDSFEFNKLIGAFLAVVFVMFSISLASDALFASHAPEKFGYEIAAAEDGAGAGGPAAEAGPSALSLLATADAAAGEAAFRKCTACHTAEKGGANKIGPNLWDVINRPIASHEGFSYSAGMREFSQGGTVHWDYEHISGFLVAPRAYVSGTAMAFAGIKNPQEEANLIAYLRSLSDNPAPLPEVAAEGAAEGNGEAAPAADGEAAPDADGTAPGANAPTEPAPANGQPAPAQPQTPNDGTSAAPQPDASNAQPAAPQPDNSAPAPAQSGETPPNAPAAPANPAQPEQPRPAN